MLIPLQISAHGVPLSTADEATIVHAADALETFADRITSCRVAVALPHRHHRTGIPYAVRVDVGLPQGEVVVTRQSDPNLKTAVQAAFSAARRRVQDHMRVLRGDTKQLDERPVGTVARLLPWEGYGFLTDPSGREIYFHRNAVVDEQFDRLTAGTDCRYVEAVGDEGPQASTVIPIWRTAP